MLPFPPLIRFCFDGSKAIFIDWSAFDEVLFDVFISCHVTLLLCIKRAVFRDFVTFIYGLSWTTSFIFFRRSAVMVLILFYIFRYSIVQKSASGVVIYMKHFSIG